MSRALIICGTGRYSDPWHPFAQTSECLARVLDAAGHDTRIDDDVDGAMTRLDGIDLLVMNAGDPWRGENPRDIPAAESIAGFADALERGIGVLALHTSVASLRDYPEWATAVGGMWLPGLSWHPPAGETTIRGGIIPSGEAVADFDLFDERYCRLQSLGRSHVIAWHDSDGASEPAAWVRTVGRSRVAVDVLGHDERSYASAGHRQLIRQLATWCTASFEPAKSTMP